MDEFERTNRVTDLKSRFIELSSRLRGRTTRLVDSYIQDIYEHQGEWVEIEDHNSTPQDNRIVLNRIIARMELEHNGDVIKIDKRHKIPKIMLVKCRREESLSHELSMLRNEIEELEKQDNNL